MSYTKAQGTVPVNLLLFNKSDTRFVKPPKDEGSEPTSPYEASERPVMTHWLLINVHVTPLQADPLEVAQGSFA